MGIRRFLLASLGLAALAGNASAALVYSYDFDASFFMAPGVTVSGVGVASADATTGTYAGSNGKSWSGYFLNGYGTSYAITWSNLPTHDYASIDMLLGFLNSWDSRNGSVAPDNLDIYIDGNLVLNMTTNNASGTIVDFDGGTLLVDNGQIDGTQFYSDDLVDMATASALTFAHSSSTLTMLITPSGAGWQGWTDEGWGLDALSLFVGTRGGNVPEPATLMLLGMGVAGMGFARRRRRS